MSKTIIYSSHNYTSAISKSISKIFTNIVEAENEQSFYKYLNDEKFNLIIVDSDKEKNVFEICENCRISGQNMKIPILYLVPGKVSYSEYRPKGDVAPIVGISKPFSAAAIRNLTSILLETNLQTEKLINSYQEIEHFSIMTAHDLKTPLKNILSYSDILRDEIKGDEFDKEELIEFSQIIYKQTKKMIRFVDDIFEYSRAGTVDILIEEVDFHELLDNISEQVISDYESDKEKINIMYNNTPKFLFLDNAKVSHILQNLIENSVKYSVDPIVNIQIDYKQIREHEFCIFVKDDGPGIREEDIDKIFLPFRRGKSKKKGTGIGLAIVKKLIDILGGEIGVEKNSDHGATFYFVLSDIKLKDIKEKRNEVAW